jgi:hypothetical protein
MTNFTFANNTLLVVTGATGTSSPVSGTGEVWTAASWSSMPIANPAGSPPTAFHIADPLLPSEIIAVTNSSTGAVTRGAEGTTPVAHATGATYYQVISAGDLGNLIQGTAASFDAAGAATTALTTAEAFTTASYAPLASPAFTGNPTAPTQTSTDNTTKLATTAFVTTAAAAKAPLASPTFTGTPLITTTPSPGDSTTKIADTAFVAASFAPLASPTFTGTPAAPTGTPGDTTTQIATDAFVAAAISSIPGTTPGAWTSIPLSSASPNFTMRTGGYTSRYRKNIEGDMEVQGEWSCTSCSGTQALSTTLPSGFHPTYFQDIPGGWSSTGSPTSSPCLALSTSGVLTWYNLPAGTTVVQFHGVFPLT